jgi:hypothetical protein
VPDAGEKSGEEVLKSVRMSCAEVSASMASFEVMAMAPSESNKEKRVLMLCHQCGSDIPFGEALRGTSQRQNTQGQQGEEHCCRLSVAVSCEKGQARSP